MAKEEFTHRSLKNILPLQQAKIYTLYQECFHISQQNLNLLMGENHFLRHNNQDTYHQMLLKGWRMIRIK